MTKTPGFTTSEGFLDSSSDKDCSDPFGTANPTNKNRHTQLSQRESLSHEYSTINERICQYISTKKLNPCFTTRVQSISLQNKNAVPFVSQLFATHFAYRLFTKREKRDSHTVLRRAVLILLHTLQNLSILNLPNFNWTNIDHKMVNLLTMTGHCPYYGHNRSCVKPTYGQNAISVIVCPLSN